MERLPVMFARIVGDLPNLALRAKLVPNSPALR